LLAREGEQLAHQARRPLAFCLICMMSWNEDRSAVALSRKSVAIMMADNTLLKSWAMPPEAGDEFHLLLLRDFVLELALRGGLERGRRCRLLVALLSSTAVT